MEHVIDLADDVDAIQLFGVRDSNLRRLREHFEIEIHARGRSLCLAGDETRVTEAQRIFERMMEAATGDGRDPEDVLAELLSCEAEEGAPSPAPRQDAPFDLDAIGRTAGQRHYLRAIHSRDIVVAYGPAGTGKTYLAVRMAVEALKTGSKKKLILCRPAVEAGESLGFLPGDFHAKVNPYLRPLYDALHSMLDYDQIRRYTDREIIEIVPLAYMRGRTLSDAFIILDEGQNTTPSQMKMFLTRMGEGSKIVVTGDPSQVDLPPGSLSGLLHARRVLAKVDGIAWVELTAADIVRHGLVTLIVDAYERHEQAAAEGTGRGRKFRKRKPR